MRPTSLLTLAALLLASTATAQSFDVVVANGRVMDPESGLDAVRNVGIRGGRIAAISAGPLAGKRTIDAKGLVVAPGFIDLHVHGQTPETDRYQALDGVTSTFELEVGTDDVAKWYADRDGGRLINYGVSVGHIPVRMAIMHDPGGFLPSGDAAHREATPAEIAEMERRIDEGLKQGAVAVGFGPAYTAGASRWEIVEMFRVAAAHHASAHIHVRSAIGGGLDGLEEAIAAAAVTGAPLHVVHVNSTSGPWTREALRMIDGARARGLDITTEAYPYTAGMTSIQAAMFDDWQTWPDARFATHEWPLTGERLTRETFARYRQTGGNVIIHSNTEEMVDAAIESPLTMIASDGFMADGKGHPRTTGTYAKVLGRYARDGKLSLMNAIRKMTLMPARRLEPRVPAMRARGRVKVGADADLTLFDPATVIDRSTYKDPTLPPAGIRYVLVNGTPVVSDGQLVGDVKPGRAIRAPIGK